MPRFTPTRRQLFRQPTTARCQAQLGITAFMALVKHLAMARTLVTRKVLAGFLLVGVANI